MPKKTQDVPAPITIIKNFCRLLASHTVTEVTASYDGSGDSGNMDVTFRIAPPPKQTPGPVPSDAPVIDSWSSSHEFFKTPTVKKDPLITKEKIAEFEDALYEMLPGGWEIDDGSYGEITVDMRDFKVRIEHNERITEVNSSSAEY